MGKVWIVTLVLVLIAVGAVGWIKAMQAEKKAGDIEARLEVLEQQKPIFTPTGGHFLEGERERQRERELERINRQLQELQMKTDDLETESERRRRTFGP